MLGEISDCVKIKCYMVSLACGIKKTNSRVEWYLLGAGEEWGCWSKGTNFQL